MPLSVYSMGDGFRQGYLCFVGGKKNNKKLQASDFFLVGDILKFFVVFWTEKLMIRREKITFFSA